MSGNPESRETEGLIPRVNQGIFQRIKVDGNTNPLRFRPRRVRLGLSQCLFDAGRSRCEPQQAIPCGLLLLRDL